MDLNLKDEMEINVEPGELLEDCWFFGNTKSKSRMLRSFSDPCSSSNFAGSSYEETYESIKQLSRDRTPAARSNGKASSRNSLVRAPSLPTSLETGDFDDEEEEMEFSMGKLIRQASLNYSAARPPRTNAPKSSSLRRRKTEAESVKLEVNKLTTQKSLKGVGIEELQGFKDLGLDLEERERSPDVVGNVEKRTSAEESARTYVAEAPPVPRWGGKRSTEDMKAKIKFWARAVASNVRQEC